MKVTAVFDIGKTNKKFFLFNRKYEEILKVYEKFETLEDDDGYPCEDLHQLTRWMQDVFRKALQNKHYEVQSVNFSTYGASLVHVDRSGDVVTPVYNYTKPYPADISRQFYQNYGPEAHFAQVSGSPPSGMLNAGLQLYWLKQTRPESYQRIHLSLHFPQYLSYLFTGIPLSDYTSIGCHTGLWDYKKEDYHDWVYREEIDQKLPPIVTAHTNIGIVFGSQRLRVGAGIHDSSSALLPYLLSDDKPFILISTGTWSISLNPFNGDPITREEYAEDCLYYMRINGQPVKASRLFLGREYETQVKVLDQHFKKPADAHRAVRFDPQLYSQLARKRKKHFVFEYIDRPENPQQPTFDELDSYEAAFHQLMIELMELQIRKVKLIQGTKPVRKIYVDGGFAENELFIELLAAAFPGIKLRRTISPLGSALGAALVISHRRIPDKFLKEHYGLKKHKPQISLA